MQLSQLRYLVTGAETQSVAKTAQACFTTRQNVDSSIKKLESELGTRFFIREGNIITLTEDGKEATRLADNVLRACGELSRYFTTEKYEEPLRVSFGDPLLALTAPSSIHYLSTYPGGPVNYSETSAKRCWELVMQGVDDVAFVMGTNNTFPDCECIPVSSGQLYALVRSDFPAPNQTHVHVRNLSGHRVLMPGGPEFQYRRLMDQLRRYGINEENACVIHDIKTAATVVRETGAVAIVSARFALPEMEDVIAMPFSDTSLRWNITALVNPHTPKKNAINALLGHLRPVFKLGVDLSLLEHPSRPEQSIDAQPDIR